MMALLFLALLASTIVLPTIVVVRLASRIMGRGPWLDYDSGSLVEAIDAIES